MEDGDSIDINVADKTMTLEVDNAELKRRKDAWTAPPLKVGVVLTFIAALIPSRETPLPPQTLR